MNPSSTDYPTIAFTTAAKWRAWLSENHDKANGVWLRLYKKASGLPTVTYAEALDEALCFGWIDGMIRRYDEQSYVQKFTPRRKASLWSKQNTEHIERLTKAGLMMPAGLAEVARAKADGRWDAAYDKPSQMTVPPDFLDLLKQQPAAETAFNSLNKSAKYSIAWKLQTAKTA